MITASIIKEMSECFSFIYVYITNAKLTEFSIKAFSHITYLTEIYVCQYLEKLSTSTFLLRRKIPSLSLPPTLYKVETASDF